MGSRERGFGIVVATAIAFVVMTASAGAYWTIGSKLGQEPGMGYGCLEGCTLANKTIAPGDAAPDGATAPVAGLVTEWAMRTIDVGDAAATVRLRALTAPETPPYDGFGPPMASPGTIATARSGTESLQQIDGVQRFESHMPIGAGERIGIDLLGEDGRSDYPPFLTGGSPGSEVDTWSGVLPDGGTGQGVYNPGHLLLQARVETDADGDGFGDESQDGCPTDPAHQCTPSTRIVRAKKKGKGRKVRLRFASNDRASSFECALDAGTFEPCRARTTVRGLERGTHGFEVRAVSAGVHDPTPAKVKLRISKKRG
jgi:hypothetical protein